jgi:ATP-dependent helicase/nuclease subunit A
MKHSADSQPQPMNFTPQQQAAITRNKQDVCVVAGPGSGKTRVLVERFGWLIENKTSPLQILAITFTEKAATEIKRRLVERFGKSPGLREQIERAYVSTVHGFCARILRENAIAAGIDPEFSVLDAPQSEAALQDAATKVLETMFRDKPHEFSALLDALPSLDLAACLIDVYQAIRVAGVPLDKIRDLRAALAAAPSFDEFLNDVESVFAEEPPGWDAEKTAYFHGLRQWSRRILLLRGKPVSPEHFGILEEFDCKLTRLKRGNAIYDGIKRIRGQEIPAVKATLMDEFFADQRELLIEILARIDQAYSEHKEARGALDFSDLEERTVVFLRENLEQRNRIRSEFKAILMDELQDTNPLQWQLIDLIRSPGQFFGVGDINQSIYGFRHADPVIFRRYRDQVADKGHIIDELPHNHRSRADILTAVDLVVGGAAGIEPHKLIAEKEFPVKQAPSVEVIAGCHDVAADAVRIEAQWVARRVREIEGKLIIGEPGEERPAGFRDIAVLVRAMNAWSPLRKAFDELNIPYLVSGGRTFFEAREVRDLTQWLSVLANPLDEIALAGVLRSPLVGVGDETLLRLKLIGPLFHALERMDQPGAATFHPEDLERLRSFRSQLMRTRGERDSVSPDRLLARALDECDYESGLDDLGRANVEKFLARLRDWFQERPRPLPELLQDLEWLRNSESEPEAPPDDSSNAVRVMSIHNAKGLEFPVVFLPSLQRGINRSTPPLCFSGNVGLGVCWRDPASGAGTGDRVYESFSEELKRREAEEEDRLLYVAMTRAEEHLVLSFARVKSAGSKWWKKVAEGLGVDLDRIENASREYEHKGLTVRAAIADKPPEDAFEILPPQAQHLPELLGRPALTDQHDSAAPVTSVSIFDECPRRYYLARYLGWEKAARPRTFPEDEDRDQPAASEFGIQVHALLAGESVENPHPEALELVSRFHTSALGRRLARAQHAEREFDFLMALEDVVLRGQIDLWFEEGGELVLVDYKTDEVDAAQAPQHAESYALQLRLYACALERLTGRLPDRAFLYMLRPDVCVPVALGAPELEAAKASVRAFREAQASLTFPLHEGNHCWRCPFFHNLCPAG